MNSNRAYIGALLIATAGFLFWVLVMPKYDEISKLKDAKKEWNGILKGRDDLIATINTLNEEYERKAADIDKFSGVIPAKKNTAELLSSIQALIIQNGLGLTGISLTGGQPQETDSYLIQPISLDFTGTYSAFRSFLTALETNLRLIDVISINASAAGDNLSQLTFQIKANAYYLK